MNQPAYSYPLYHRQEQPMSDEQIARVAPAVFATEPDIENVSDRYSFIPTSTVLAGLRDQGYEVFACGQHRTHNPQNEMFKRHMLRLRLPGKVGKKVGDVIPEIALMNAHDATTRYTLFAGLLRFICLNGMVVGDETLSPVSIVHTGGDETTAKVIEESSKIADLMPRIVAHKNDMGEKQLTQNQRIQFAEQALTIRYGTNLPALKPADLLRIHRMDDADMDLWTTFNVVQENVTNAEHETVSIYSGRKQRVGRVEQVAANTRINTRLWNAATELLAA